MDGGGYVPPYLVVYHADKNPDTSDQDNFVDESNDKDREGKSRTADDGRDERSNVEDRRYDEEGEEGGCEAGSEGVVDVCLVESVGALLEDRGLGLRCVGCGDVRFEEGDPVEFRSVSLTRHGVPFFSTRTWEGC